MSAQIPLDISREPSFSRDDLVVSSANAPAVSLIDSWPDWTTEIVAIVGPVGSGKTHIAHAWALQSSASILNAQTLDVADFEEKRPYLLEDVDQHPIDESTLFHLINAVRQNGKTLLLTARSWPASWNIQLPDLVSRLRAITLVELFEPDDELLTGVIYKLIADRQMKVEEPTIRYLVTHMERSLGSANAFIAELDRRALAEKRAITRPFAASLLAEYQQPDFLVDD